MTVAGFDSDHPLDCICSDCEPGLTLDQWARQQPTEAPERLAVNLKTLCAEVTNRVKDITQTVKEAVENGEISGSNRRSIRSFSGRAVLEKGRKNRGGSTRGLRDIKWDELERSIEKAGDGK